MSYVFIFFWLFSFLLKVVNGLSTLDWRLNHFNGAASYWYSYTTLHYCFGSICFFLFIVIVICLFYLINGQMFDSSYHGFDEFIKCSMNCFKEQLIKVFYFIFYVYDVIFVMFIYFSISSLMTFIFIKGCDSASVPSQIGHLISTKSYSSTKRNQLQWVYGRAWTWLLHYVL